MRSLLFVHRRSGGGEQPLQRVERQRGEDSRREEDVAGDDTPPARPSSSQGLHCFRRVAL